MSFVMDQVPDFDFDYSVLGTEEALTPSTISTMASGNLEKLQKRNEELEQINSELLGMLNGFKHEMNELKENLEGTKEEIKSTRTHNARLQGEISSLSKRRRAAAKTKSKDLELSQAAKIAELEKELAQSKLQMLPVPRSETSSVSSADDLTLFFGDSSTSSRSSRGSVEDSRPRKRSSPGIGSWEDPLDVFQFGVGQGNQQNTLLDQVPQGGQNQQGVSMAPMAQLGGLAEDQHMPGYPQFYSHGHMEGPYNQVAWGTGYASNPQPRQGHSMPACPSLPAGHQFSGWNF
ncbi:hypothetical protein F4814DRAFT_402898 [Daldinia grandis]|nr:hypothetical protein F4814DRAFT_402898 [Daldinia grandis]